ncbi:MAG: type II CAAX endopeptidase family protein [Eubacteriales bacterium]|nr:type II CAAX endopeptidase family protein [Eubacteriales bacterium]
MRTTQGRIVSVITPLLLHFFISQAVIMVFGTFCDATALTAITAGMVIPPAVMIYHREIKKYQDRGKDKVKIRELILIAVIGVAASQALTWFLNVIGVTQYFSNETQEALFAGNIFVQILGAGIFAPIAEELIFRGLTYQRMKRMAGMGWAMILSSVLFAVYHGNPIQMMYTFPLALLLCTVYEKCGSIKGPIVLHMAANLVAVAINDL